MVKTGSRGGLITLSIGLITIFIEKGVKQFVIILLLMFIFIDDNSISQFGRINTIFNLENDYNVTSDSGRLAIWKRGIEMMVKNPLFGSGTGTYMFADCMIAEGGK